MKNTLKVLVVALTILAFSGVGFAQAKPATPAIPATPAAVEKKAEKAMEAAADKVDGAKAKGKKAKAKAKGKAKKTEAAEEKKAATK